MENTLTQEWFWKQFRDQLVSRCNEESLNSSRAWTRAVTDAAVAVCSKLGPGVLVHKERPSRLDVSASFTDGSGLAVAFESELAPVGYMGRAHKKTWREEFVKLCRISAKLRVLSAYFLPGTGATFTEFLRCELDSMRDSFVAASPSEWLLLYGSENTNRDPQQAWLAFSLQPDFQLRLIDTVPPFCPRMIARGFP